MGKRKYQIIAPTASLIVSLIFILLFVMNHNYMFLLISAGTLSFGFIGVILYHSRP